jgi:hypothetical protein
MGLKHIFSTFKRIELLTTLAGFCQARKQKDTYTHSLPTEKKPLANPPRALLV